MSRKSVPTPCSTDARLRGCLCTHQDNCDGSGTVVVLAKGGFVKEFIVNPNCPLHSDPRAWFDR